MKSPFTLVFALAACAYAAPGPAAKVAPAGKPNILVILADDLGYGDVGCFGCKDIPTPNLDLLASNGVRFTDGYVTAPLCGPSRAGLLTGRSGTRFGFEENVGQSPKAKGGDNLAGIPVNERIFPEYMRAAGYATGVFGKWHIGFAPQLVPARRGFDDWACFFAGAHSYFPGPMGGKAKKGVTVDPDPIVHNGKPIESFDYTTYLFAKAAADFIGQHRAQPWFVYLPFNAVHGPLGTTEALKQRFSNLSGKRQTYAGMLSAMDDGVGMVMAKLRECGLEENTLVFFTSDNGGPTAVTSSSNFPLSGFKGQLWEGGMREPFIIQWKNHIPDGQVFTNPVSTLDFLPTALAVAGLPSNPKLEGVNLLPYLTGEKTGSPNPMLCWRINGQRAIRMGDWKLLDMAQGQGWQLFNLVADIAEKNDLREKEPARAAELEAAFKAWDAKNVPAKWLFTGAATEYGEKTLSKGLIIDNELDVAPALK